MFKYQDTKKVSSLGEQQRKVVLKGREVTYINEYQRENKTFKKVSKGWEIVEERVVSPTFQAPERLGFVGGDKVVTILHKKKARKKVDNDEIASE